MKKPLKKQLPASQPGNTMQATLLFVKQSSSFLRLKCFSYVNRNKPFKENEPLTMSVNDQQLIQTIEYISSLLLKRVKEELNAEEQAALNDWLSQRADADRQFFDTITSHDEIEKALQYMYGIDEERALADVLNSIEPVQIQAFPVVPVRKLRFGTKVFVKYMAAAIVTGAVVTATIVVLNWKGNKDIAHLTVAQRYHNDVLPGNNKAILQLADGSSIVLDSMNNGKIGDQGGTAVNKQDILRTPRGGQYQLQLPDGSKVWLNAQSSIRFPTAFTGNERVVDVTGEAYFEVEKNPNMPFRVNMLNASGKTAGQVEVLGTHFNINAYDDEEVMRTTLLEGKVKLSSMVNGEWAMLKPGEQSSLSQSSQLSHPIPVQTEEITAWKNGLFRFQDASIESIMRQIGRWYNVDIVYERKIDKQFIGTIPRQVPVSTVLKILESTGWVHFTIEGKKITVAP
jgi:ferric-dicitrate binding protein FerR (iron transport regulator)